MSDRVFPLRYRWRPAGLGQRLAFAGLEVRALDVAALRFAPDDPRIASDPARVEAVAAGDREPVAVLEVAAFPPARTAPRAVVLRAAADVVGHAIVVAHFVELPDRAGLHRSPKLPPLSYVMYMPPSFPMTMCSGSFGSIQSA